ncbi:heptaprenyl diphosphate synthase component II [Desmospora activa]|uniref:Heptaprenyl diphosphate synthase component 2 n=1 Tax=Desmospora activa DSM 45169 TaxID=1121389 RepID=A0A2T4Z9X6_9BACL|nr:heptaprenyl diphosphate synthase component II [Desmospora activa]PTM58680.1 heptaprenyl diphosphate synthase [Desmospora activa DSM 45169]
MKLVDIYKNLRQDLRVVERELSRSVRSNHTELDRSAAHLLEAGGKRIRPVFTLLAGQFGDYDMDRLQKVAVPLEIIHMASLVHDDVIDNSETRRGRTTVKAEWDNRVAMYTGDFLFARALSIASQLDDPRVHQVLSRSIREMCRGEIEQIREFYNPDQDLICYLRRIKRKTALLMAVSCQVGAMVASAEEAVVRRLRLYGYYVGMAFQITDDVLDLTGDEKELGKPAGSDLRQGNVTLPVIYLLHHGSQDDVRRIRDYLAARGEGVGIADVLERVRRSDGIAYANAVSRRYLDKALQCLEGLPPGEARHSLHIIAQFIGKRSY